MATKYPAGMDTAEDRAHYDEFIAKRSALAKEAIKAIKDAGLRYESLDGYHFRLMAPLNGGRYLEATEVIEFIKNYLSEEQTANAFIEKWASDMGIII